MSFFFVFCLLLSLLYQGTKAYKDLNAGRFSIRYPLSCFPGSILHLCVSFISLYLLPNISDSHAPTLEHTNPSWLDMYLGWQRAPQNVTYDTCVWVYDVQVCVHACSHVCRCRSVRVREIQVEVDIWCLLQSLFTVFTETNSLPEPWTLHQLTLGIPALWTDSWFNKQATISALFLHGCWQFKGWFLSF